MTSNEKERTLRMLFEEDWPKILNGVDPELHDIFNENKESLFEAVCSIYDDVSTTTTDRGQDWKPNFVRSHDKHPEFKKNNTIIWQRDIEKK